MTRAGQSAAADTDRQLMERTAAGDHAAFAELMSRHQDMVFAVALRIMRNRQAALDATQDTFLTVLRKADRYAGDAEVSTWLYRVATNKCLDHLRSQKRRRAVPLTDEHDATDSTADAGLDAIEVRSNISAALASIPDHYRAAVVLSDVEGLTIGEMVEVLGIPPGTVKSRIFRGRRMLADKLEGLRERSRSLAPAAL
ncbi:MAG: sigma-70 family RNA polymerase sigma factor [Acidimicrobiia bacterium]